MRNRGQRLAIFTGLMLATAVATAQPCGRATLEDAPPLYPLPEGDRWGFVGGDGEWRLAPQWQQARPFSEGVAAVATEGGWGLIDRDGKYILAPGARDADRVVIEGKSFALSPYKPMSQGCSAATPEGETPHYVTAAGERWMPPGLQDETVLDLGSFSEGLAWVRVARGNTSGVGWIDTRGQLVITPEFSDGGDFSGGRAPAAVGPGNRGYINTSGELVFPHKYVLQEAQRYGDGLAPVRLDGESGYMNESDWALREVTSDAGDARSIEAASPFSDGRAAVLPGPVWIDTSGAVAVNPQAGARYAICNTSRMPGYQNGLLPLVVGDGSGVCGKTPAISYRGPGDPRSGPQQMLWHLPWTNAKLVWLDRDGATAIDSVACRRPPGVAALPVVSDDGGLAAGAYHVELSGEVEGDTAPARADAPCNLSAFEMDGNTATNAGGPWRLSLHGQARWRDLPVNFNLSLSLPAGSEVGQYPLAAPGDDGSASAYLWVRTRDAGPNAPRPPTYVSREGTLDLARRDQEAISGNLEMIFVSRDAPEDRVSLTAEFNNIPYTRGAEVEVLSTTGAVTELDKATPDDPLVNFFTPARARESVNSLILSLGKYGPKIDLVLPRGFSGEFSAGAGTPVSVSFAGAPGTATGEIQRVGDRITGEFTVHLGDHAPVDGTGSVTLRVADLPVEQSE